MSLAKEAAEKHMRNLGEPGSLRFDQIQRRLSDIHHEATRRELYNEGPRLVRPVTKEVISARLDQLEALRRQQGTMGLKAGYLAGGLLTGGLSWFGGPPKTDPAELAHAYQSSSDHAKKLLEEHSAYRKRFAEAHREHRDKVEALLKKREDPKFLTRLGAKLTSKPSAPSMTRPEFRTPEYRKPEFTLRHG